MNEPVKTKRNKPSALPSIMSLALVLFMLGILGTSILAYDGLVRNLVEEVNVDVYFNDNVADKDVLSFAETLKTEKWLKKTVFVSREDGYKQLMSDQKNAELAEFISASELPLSLEIYFNANFASPDLIANTARKLESNPMVEEVIYQPNLVAKVSANIQKGQWILMGLVFIFCLISIGLINSSTRLSIFANRFLIKSMQLVGATNAFITRPLIWKFIKYALIAIPIAVLMLIGLGYGLHNLWPDRVNYSEILAKTSPVKAVIVYGGIFIFGIFMAGISVWLSTRKYLRTKIENLY